MTQENKHHLEVRVQETRMSSNGDMLVSGYVNMTNQLSYELGHIDKFVEKISPGAFTRAINRATNAGQDIDFLAEHDDTLVLASTKNGTLSLSEDETGLFMEARIINTSSGRDYYEMIKSGIITNMSFGFYSLEDDWRSVRSDLYERTINELDLFEVSAVRRPAYAASTISGRGLDLSNDEVPENIKEEFQMENRSHEELLLEAIQNLTEEVRELRSAYGKEEAVIETVEEETDEVRADGKDKDKEDKAKKAQKEQEDKEGDDSFDEKDKNADKEETDMDDDKGPEKKVDSEKEGKPSNDEKDAVDEVEKERKKKEEEDKKKRSYSLFKEEFKNLRGGNK